MENQKDLITVVVPVYNVEKYLDQCVQSVINQTYKNLQIILVDDGSTDNSGAICDKYADSDERVEVIHKLNSGLSGARNAGIDSARGAYISFIDSDDFVDEVYIERLYEEIIAHNVKIAVCEYYKLNEDEGMFYFYTKDKYVKLMNYTEYIDEIFLTETLAFVIACSKLYSIDLFRGEFPIRFPEGKLAEDKYITYLLAIKSGKIVYLRESYYCYRRRAGSITNSGASIKLAKDDIEGCESRLADLALVGYDLEKAIDWYQYVLKIHKNQLEQARLTNNEVYAKINKKIALLNGEYK